MFSYKIWPTNILQWTTWHHKPVTDLRRLALFSEDWRWGVRLLGEAACLERARCSVSIVMGERMDSVTGVEGKEELSFT